MHASSVHFIIDSKLNVIFQVFGIDFFYALTQVIEKNSTNCMGMRARKIADIFANS